MTRRAMRMRVAREPERVTLRIEQLGLYGFTPLVARRIADSLVGALECKLISLDRLPDTTAHHEKSSATIMDRKAALPEDIGLALAQAVIEEVAP